MLTRRIVTSACALSLVIPAAAGASPAPAPPNAMGPYGITPATGQSTVKAKGPYGITPAGPRNTIKAQGPYGITPAGPRNTTKAQGPYGITPATGPQDTTATSVHAAGASRRDGADGWRTAAISEAALLTALALGSALLLSVRRRGARMVT